MTQNYSPPVELSLSVCLASFKWKRDTAEMTLNTTACVSAVGDGRLGFPEGAPYDAIHVGAAAAAVPKSVGRLVFWLIFIFIDNCKYICNYNGYLSMCFFFFTT